MTFTGFSGVGKTTLVKELLQDPQYALIPSVTTRNSRLSDLPGEYDYVTDLHFDWLKCWDAFLWGVSFAGNRYGTTYESIDAALKSPLSSVMILVPHAVKELRNHVSEDNIKSFYICSPEEHILRARMERRGEMQDNIERRLKESKGWDEQAQKSGIPYIFITNNGTVEEAVELVRSYLKSD